MATEALTIPDLAPNEPANQNLIKGFMDHLGHSRLARVAACGAAVLVLSTIAGCEGEAYDGPPVTVGSGEGVFNHPNTQTQCGTTTANTHEYPTLFNPTPTGIDTMYGWNKPSLSGVKELPGKSCGALVWTFGTPDAKK